MLGNAVKFTLKGKVLFNVSSKMQGDGLHFNFIIEDTGVGFDDSDVNIIFNEFEQVEDPDKHAINKEGTGLGLAIVRELVESQGGRIYVKSKIDEGTTFNIFLKYLVAQHQIEEPIFKTQQSAQKKRKVWVVDDDQLILELCGLIFNQHDIPFEIFNSATQILEAPEDKDVKFVLVDMRLPEMTGLELHGILKDKMPNDVKFYAITAQVLPDEKDSILAVGFEGIIMKPFKAADLLSVFDENFVEEAISYDLTSLEKMTMGDRQMLEKILLRFEKDCFDDIEELQQSVELNNIDRMRLIVHRLAGRIAQIGANDLGTSFRRLEHEIALQNTLGGAEKAQVEMLVLKLKDLMKLIQIKD